ncbi:MAG: plasmid stabilization protein [Thermoleophilia bacterium]|jgi:plasmid stability protein|nr:plasmid stabilization protein [Thermoleophilia bacterium]
MASLTIRGLDEALKTNLRLEAARHGYSMEEAARQILRRALMTPDMDTGGLGTRVHQYFVEADSFDLDLPERSAPRAVPDFSDRRA